MNVHTANIEGPINTEKINHAYWPDIESDAYLRRIEALLLLSEKNGFDCLLIYADREHFSNMEYLTGYDPRFEESLLLLRSGERPSIVVGIEGEAYSGISPLHLRRYVYSGFGLMGQPSEGKKLKDILLSCGIAPGDRVGVVGWKTYRSAEFEDPDHVLDIPSYIVEILAGIVKRENLLNATGLLTDNGTGLRSTLELKEIIQAEIMNTKASRAVYNALGRLKEGVSEYEASRYLEADGDPMFTYPAMSFGERNVSWGLASPRRHTCLRRGDVLSVGIGYRRAMVHRSMVFADGPKEFLRYFGQDTLKFYMDYFALMRAWYESLGIGVTGGEVYEAVGRRAGAPERLGIRLNMGHQIHTEEWINSLFYEGSGECIRSGMAIQCDIIAGSENPYATVHVEDGIIIADQTLRNLLEKEYPQSHQRIKKRRAFLKNVLHIDLKEEILPLSDIQGMLFPYAADTGKVLV